jgi:hypothetical protein
VTASASNSRLFLIDSRFLGVGAPARAGSRTRSACG